MERQLPVLCNSEWKHHVTRSRNGRTQGRVYSEGQQNGVISTSAHRDARWQVWAGLTSPLPHTLGGLTKRDCMPAAEEPPPHLSSHCRMYEAVSTALCSIIHANLFSVGQLGRLCTWMGHGYSFRKKYSSNKPGGQSASMESKGTVFSQRETGSKLYVPKACRKLFLQIWRPREKLFSPLFLMFIYAKVKNTCVLLS